ncbi:hypothetical protein ACFL96_12760 [Thermoproteota archaeon]
MAKFLGSLAYKIAFIFVMSSFMTLMPLMVIYKTDIEWLQNFQMLSLTMFAATATTTIIFWMRGRGK